MGLPCLAPPGQPSPVREKGAGGGGGGPQKSGVGLLVGTSGGMYSGGVVGACVQAIDGRRSVSAARRSSRPSLFLRCPDPGLVASGVGVTLPTRAYGSARTLTSFTSRQGDPEGGSGSPRPVSCFQVRPGPPLLGIGRRIALGGWGGSGRSREEAPLQKSSLGGGGGWSPGGGGGCRQLRILRRE